MQKRERKIQMINNKYHQRLKKIKRKRKKKIRTVAEDSKIQTTHLVVLDEYFQNDVCVCTFYNYIIITM